MKETRNAGWERLRDALTEAANKVVPVKRRKEKQKWMTETILNKMDERCK